MTLAIKRDYPRTFMLTENMQVQGDPPMKLVKALAVITEYLHDYCDRSGFYTPGKSKESCILCTAIVRDFLYRIGFRDADLRPVVVLVAGHKDGVEVHTLGIGDARLEPGENVIWNGSQNRWNGHAVVVTSGYLIDTTLYQAQREDKWPGLPGMTCTPLNTVDKDLMWGLPILGGCMGLAENGVETGVVWLDQPGNTGWSTSPDYLRKHERRRISEALVKAFGKWTDN